MWGWSGVGWGGGVKEGVAEEDGELRARERQFKPLRARDQSPFIFLHARNRTALHAAAEGGHQHTVELLLSSRAEPLIRDQSGYVTSWSTPSDPVTARPGPHLHLASPLLSPPMLTSHPSFLYCPDQ